MDAIDSHQHFWRLDRGDYGWLTPDPALAPIYRDFLPAELAPQLARAGITRTVAVQAAPTVAETRYLLGLAREHAFIAGVVGWVDFEAADAPRVIAELARDARLVGLRPMIQGIPDPEWMLKRELTPAFEAMLRHELVFDALVLPKHLRALRALTARHPDLRVVIDHGAKPELAGGDLTAWKRDIAVLADETGCVCKLSGLVTEAGSAEPARLAPAVEHLVARFGARRLMWGSDWPVCTLVCSHSAWWDVTQELIGGLSEADREHLFFRVAQQTYDL